MCPNCDAFTERLTFNTPEDYVSFVRLLVAETSEGRLSLVFGDCALEKLTNSPPWPMGVGDAILHELQCTKCGQFFQLCVNIWNGRNWWKPQSAEEWAASGEPTTPGRS